MSSVAIQGNAAGAGVFTIASPNSASSYTLTLPAATGTLGINGPAFSAYLGTTQNLTTNTITKVAIDTEFFDTNSCYDITTYRFTPTVAGYYQVNATVRFSATATTITQAVIQIYKNGTSFAVVSVDNVPSTVFTSQVNRNGSTIISMNGTTDYIELYASVTGTSPQLLFGSSANTCLFSASLVRGA
jgi:hypothetical protein